MNYSESDAIKAYIWLNYNKIIPIEYWIYKKERALSKLGVIGNDDGKPGLNHQYNNGILKQLSDTLDGIDESQLDESMEQLIKSEKWGPLVINRCKDCGKVLKTRESKQCLWCKSDWH